MEEWWCSSLISIKALVQSKAIWLGWFFVFLHCLPPSEFRSLLRETLRSNLSRATQAKVPTTSFMWRLSVQQYSYGKNTEFVDCDNTFNVSPVNLTGGSILIPSFLIYSIFFFQPALITTYILYLLCLQRQGISILQTGKKSVVWGCC